MENYLRVYAYAAQLRSLAATKCHECTRHPVVYFQCVIPFSERCSQDVLISTVVSIIFIDGLVKSDSPGSLRQPARTTMFPDNWATLPLSFGLMMCESTTSFVHVPT